MQNHLSFLGAMQQSRPRPGDEAHGGGPGEAVRVPQSEVAPNGAVFTVLQKSRRALKKKKQKTRITMSVPEFHKHQSLQETRTCEIATHFEV